MIQEKAQKMKEVTVEELKQLHESNSDFQLIDVREEFEYEQSNLGGTHIPLAEIISGKDQVSRDRQVIIHCRSGKRSAQAIQILEREGFDNLYNLKGGILAWKASIDPSLNVY